jgi:UDP-glucose 6-dehydrogenase
MKVSIIGFGWVGKAMYKLFPHAYLVEHHSRYHGRANESDVAFICVPTPCLDERRLDISAVEECVGWCECPLLVIRSTVNPGDCEMLAKKYNKHICMQPEYLGESPQHPMLNLKTRQFLVIGGEPKDRRTLIELYTAVYNANITIRQVSLLEAEVIKLTENRAIAFKVTQCHELWQVCEKAGMDYYTVRDAVFSDDPRFNLWFTFVHPDKLGFNSKCLPKDVYAWAAWAESVGYKPDITNAILERNKQWISP